MLHKNPNKIFNSTRVTVVVSSDLVASVLRGWIKIDKNNDTKNTKQNNQI